MNRNRPRTSGPTQECIASGIKFGCQIDRKADGHSGSVRDEQGVVRWRFRVRNNAFGRGPGNPFNKPDFVIAEPDAQNELIIRRASFIPPVFNIIETGTIIGRIGMRSIFRNKYAIDIHGVNSWTFRMPLSTVRFYGESSVGAEIWVAVGPSKMEWNILIKPGVKEQPLVAALSFIHTEWWNYG
jgi:hypothetical protein